VAEIIDVLDLPTTLQSADMVEDMVAGANAKASRVAPCLTNPTFTAWVASTAYTAGDQVRLATGAFLEVTVAGTSGATIPTIPAAVGSTVTDGTATWKRIAPTSDGLAEAKLVLLGAVKRWAEAGAGAIQSQTAGPYNMTLDTRQRTGFNLWPSEITDLQAICATSPTGRLAFSIDTAPGANVLHADICSLNFGALYCSCGVDIAGFPLFGA